MRRWLLVGLLAAMVVACRPEMPPTGAEPAASASSVSDGGTGKPPVNIGDVEQAVQIQVTLATEPLPPNYVQELMMDPRKDLNLARVTVSPPLPDALPVKVAITSRRGFPTTPVVLRLKAYADEREVGSYTAVLGKEADQNNLIWTVDPLAGVPGLPDSLLVLVKGEALLMPEGTDPATVDPATATVPPERHTSTVLSNPLRVTFEKGAASGGPAAPATPAPAPEASAVSAAPATS